MHRRAVLGVGFLALLTACSNPTDDAGGDDRKPRRFTDSAGLASDYLVFARNVRRPAGLLLFFHGDGAWEPDPARSAALGGAGGIIEQARRRNLVTALLRTPDTGTNTWYRNGAANAAWTAELLTDLQHRYDTESNRIWLVGYSGGAHFLTRQLIPARSELIGGGGAVLFSGGGPPSDQTAELNPQLRNDFRMFFYVGADDTNTAGRLNSVTTAEAGERWYAAAGIRVHHEFPPGVGHDLGDRMGPVLGRQLDLR
ncbi:alpha/beta hydrolase [Enemella evansiae]|uniref:hypothetical protein n=1 Tax=Enemella evansiae TaxID=2016499 RepID=UPI00117E1C2B|nr:hypothetical protein [Enemella evansiae]